VWMRLGSDSAVEAMLAARPVYLRELTTCYSARLGSSGPQPALRDRPLPGSSVFRSFLGLVTSSHKNHPKGHHRSHKSSRRKFIRSVAAAGAALGAVGSPSAQQMGRVGGFDHVALPMANTDAMLAFYKALGFDIVESSTAISVYVGESMINFHRPMRWQDKTFTTRAPAAVPPCGDLCFVWDGTAETPKAVLDRAAAKIELGPVPRQGGRRKTGSSVYVRDPDGNLLEFMIYA
jgi:catechol 2,3-dioxygenase-like lactoylglutathione lyase family enzyme